MKREIKHAFCAIFILVGIFTFFVEKMLCDYYVDWKIKRFSKVCPDSTWSLTEFGIRHW